MLPLLLFRLGNSADATPPPFRRRAFGRWRIKHPDEYDEYERQAVVAKEEPKIISQVATPRAPQIIIEPAPVDFAAVVAQSSADIRRQIRSDVLNASQAYRDFSAGLIAQEAARQAAEQEAQHAEALMLIEIQRLEMQTFIDDDEIAAEILLLM